MATLQRFHLAACLLLMLAFSAMSQWCGVPLSQSDTAPDLAPIELDTLWSPSYSAPQYQAALYIDKTETTVVTQTTQVAAMNVGPDSEVVIKSGGRLVITSTCATSCSPSCANGRCVGPNVCQCNDGWTGATCNVAITTGLCGAPREWKKRYSGGEAALEAATSWTNGKTPDLQAQLHVSSPVIETKARLSANQKLQVQSLTITGEAIVEVDETADLIVHPSCVPQCPAGCVNGTCIGFNQCQCNDGFWGSICNTPCGGNCTRCNSAGQCLQCASSHTLTSQMWQYGWENGVSRYKYADYDDLIDENGSPKSNVPGYCCLGPSNGNTCHNLNRLKCGAGSDLCGDCAPGTYWDPMLNENRNKPPTDKTTRCSLCPVQCGGSDCLQPGWGGSERAQCASCATGLHFHMMTMYNDDPYGMCCKQHCASLNLNGCTENGGECGSCMEGYVDWPYGPTTPFCITREVSNERCSGRGWYHSVLYGCVCKPGYSGSNCADVAPGLELRNENATVAFGPRGDVTMKRMNNVLAINAQLNLYRSLMVKGDIKVGNPPVSLSSRVEALTARLYKLYETFCPCEGLDFD